MAVWFRIATIMLLWSAPTLGEPLASLVIGLDEGVWLGKVGFHENDSSGLSANDPDVRIMGKFPLTLNKTFKADGRQRVELYTLGTEFDVSGIIDSYPNDFALVIDRLGEQWQIFLNGTLISSTGTYNAALIDSSRYARKIRIPVARRYLKLGKNTLVIKLWGSGPIPPLSPNLLLRIDKPIKIEPLESNSDSLYNTIRFGMVMIYLCWGLYHFLLYQRRRHERYNLYFSLLTLCTTLLGTVNVGIAHTLSTDSRVLVRIHYFTVGIITPSLFLFLHSYFYPNKKLSLWLRTVYSCSGIIAVLMLLCPFRCLDATLVLSQVLATPILVIYAPYFVWRILKEKLPDAVVLAWGIAILCLTVVVSIFLSHLSASLFPFQEIATFIFITILLGLLANRFSRIHTQAETSNARLLESHSRLENVLNTTREVSHVFDMDMISGIFFKTLCRTLPGLSLDSEINFWIRDEKDKKIWKPVGSCKVSDQMYVPMSADSEIPNIDLEVSKTFYDASKKTLKIPVCIKGEPVGLFSVLQISTDFSDQGILPYCDALASSAALAIENIWHIERIKHNIRTESSLTAARAIQMSLLPESISIPGADIATYYQSAEQTGGDWYTHIYDKKANHLNIFIGDVTGHGISSAMVTAIAFGAVHAVQGSFRRLKYEWNIEPWQSQEDVLKFLAHSINDVVEKANRSGGHLMTMAMMSVDLTSGQVFFLNAGHCSPFRVCPDGTVRKIVSGGPILGFKREFSPRVQAFKLRPYETILLYTDGLMENPSVDGSVLSARSIRDVLRRLADAKFHDIIDTIKNNYCEHIKGTTPEDDCTFVGFRWYGNQQANMVDNKELKAS